MKRMRNTMGVLIQGHPTKQYYRGNGQWTSARDEAKRFEDCAAAARFIRQNKLKANILMAFGDPRYDMEIPWPPELTERVNSSNSRPNPE